MHVGRWAAVAVLAAGIGFLSAVAGSDSSVTVTQGGFELTCPSGTVVEGASLACTLENTAAEAKPWPVVAILHLSTDTDRALVRGVSIDVTLGAPSPGAAIEGGVTWIGDTLVGYSRFDWSGKAGAEGAAGSSRTVNIVAAHDGLDEDSEKFYVALGPDGSRGVGLLYNNKASITLTDEDSPSTDKSLSSLKLIAGQSHALSPTHARQSHTVGYEVTEATLTAVAARGATMSMSASFRGRSVDLDGRGGSSIEVASGEESAAVPLGVGATTVTLTVTAEDGTTGTHRVRIVRSELGDNVDTVAVSVPNFTLTCPAEVTRDTDEQCTLRAAGSAEWPVVAVLHDSADGSARALVAEDPIIPDTHPDYHKDVSLGSQQPASTAFNHGYGELFSGGSRTLYRTYGYEKFDWSGAALAGATRTVSIQIHENAANSRTSKVFYVALAPSGYTGLSQLVDNKIPVVIIKKELPSVTGVDVVSWAGLDVTYSMWEVISVRVTFSEAVNVVGTPTLAIDMDPAPGGRKEAVYAGGSGTDELTFHHTVGRMDYSSQGIAVLADTLDLNGGSIRAVTDGVDAGLAQPGLGHDPAHKVDWQQESETESKQIITLICTPAQPYDAANQRWTLVEPSAGDAHEPGDLVAGSCSVTVLEGFVAAYSLSGNDADMFEFSAEGELSFAAAPDFDAPADSDEDNVYEVTVTAGIEKVDVATSLDLAVAVTPAPEPVVVVIPYEPPPDRSMVPTSAAVSGNELTLTFNLSLAAVDDTAAAALRQSFLIHGAQDSHGNPVHNQSPSKVTVDGATVTLTLGTPIAPGREATIIYYGGLTETNGNPVPNFATALITTQRE